MRIHNQSPLPSPLNLMSPNLLLDSPCSLPPLSPPPSSKGGGCPTSLRQRRTGLSTVLETGKTVCFRVSSLKVGGFFFSYYIQHCSICRPSDSSVPTDADAGRTQDCCNWCIDSRTL